MTEEGKAPENKETPAPIVPPVEPGKTFASEDVEKIRANDKEAMTRLHTKAEKAAQELADFKAAQEKEAEEKKLANMNEVERANKIAADATAALEAERAQRRQDLINNKIVLAAQREGALKPEQVLAVIGKGGIEVSEDGTVTGVDESVAKFKEENAFHFGQARAAGGPPQGDMAGRDLPKPGADADPQARMQARLDRRNGIGVPQG